jgi:DNA-binding cell septation regulator SpoVG
MNEEFTILKMRNLEFGIDGDVVGLVDVVIGKVKIIGIKIILGRDGGFFCAMPSEKFYSKSAGKSINRAICTIEDELRELIYSTILEKWHELEGLKFKNEGGE